MSFTEIAARLFSFFRQHDQTGINDMVEITIKFPSAGMRYHVENAIKQQLKSYMIDFEGKPYDLGNFKFHGIKWEFLTK